MSEPSDSNRQPEPEGATVQPSKGSGFRIHGFGVLMNRFSRRPESESRRSTIRGLDVVVAGHADSGSDSTAVPAPAPAASSGSESEPSGDWISRLSQLGWRGRRAARANLSAQAAADLADRRHATKLTQAAAEDVRRSEIAERRRQRRAVLLEQFQAFWSPYVYVVCVTIALVGQATVLIKEIPDDLPRLLAYIVGTTAASGIEGMALSAMIIAIGRRVRGEKATGPRVMTWVFSAVAIAINGIGHHHEPIFASITVGASLGALITYEMQAYDRVIAHLRARGVVAPLLPRYGVETVRHPLVVAEAKRIARRDPAMRTFEASYTAAERVVALRGIARRAIRKTNGRAVARAVLATLTTAELELRVAESVNPNHTLAAALDSYLNPKPEPKREPEKKIQADLNPSPPIQEKAPKPELPAPNPEADTVPKPSSAPNPNPVQKVTRIASADDTALLPSVLEVAMRIQDSDGNLPGEHKCREALKTIGIDRGPKRAKQLAQRALDELTDLKELSA